MSSWEITAKGTKAGAAKAKQTKADNKRKKAKESAARKQAAEYKGKKRGRAAKEKKWVTGPRGGRYYVTPSGHKIYESASKGIKKAAARQKKDDGDKPWRQTAGVKRSR